MIGADDWSVFFDPADFARSAVWDTAAGEVVTIDGVLQVATEVFAGPVGDVSAPRPVFTTAEEFLPATAAEGDDMEIDGVNYRVSEIRLDGAGLARVTLERA